MKVNIEIEKLNNGYLVKDPRESLATFFENIDHIVEALITEEIKDNYLNEHFRISEKWRLTCDFEEIKE